jgi:EmrB/QacA subfamily drug resistance transporter
MTAEATERPSTALDPELRRLAFVVLSGGVMILLDTTMMVVAINELGRQFHTSLATIQWVLTAYLLALSMTIPLTRWAVERFGTRSVWIGSLVLFTTGSILCGASWSITMLIASRVVQGIGGGLIMPVGQTMLARVAGPDRMGRVMAVISVPAMVAPVLGPTIGGLIMNSGSWRWMFYLNVPICVFAVIFAATTLPKNSERTRARLDLTGLLLLSPGLAALVYGLSEAGKDNTWLIVGSAMGLTLITVFVVRGSSLLDTSLFRRRSFGASTAGLFAYSGAISGLTVILPLYYQLIRGESPLVAGAMLAPLGLGSMAVIPIAGRLTDRGDGRWVAVTGILIMIAGTSAYTRLEPDTSISFLASALFVVGVGHGMVFPSLQASAYGHLDRADVANGTTLANIVFRTGASFGTAALAVVLQLHLVAAFPGTGGKLTELSRLTDHTGLTHAFASTLWWALGIAAAALIPVLLIPKKAQPNRPEM